ncbi:lipid storage droplets surface-binding protein 1 isoform X2 [Aethina tumida]|uniref:lipid storage droplets surface-binding protein 1 isoform X2 n=1 Tax=Aethina tumida TaxID=116153 RepID=UPI0021498156|nr:lipid storage droplets surface-binding protein 1 isoform X2 [Aethina tumida]
MICVIYGAKYKMAHRRRRRWNRTYARYNKVPSQQYPPSHVTETVSNFGENNIQIPVVKVSSYCQTENEQMIQAKKQPFTIQNLESVNRITNIPIVESSWHYAENMYNKIKKSNNLLYWTLGQAEQSILSAVETAQPAVVLFQGPLSTIDRIVCKSLDVVEDKIPSINLPPEMIYWNTKQYVSNVGTQIVRPVLKRANSVKEIGNTVLASKYTAYAADTLDGALNVADKYVDKYLPADDDQSTDDRFSRKLKRRLTKRTLAEVKALKEHSAEAVHVLIYVAELIATDPKLAFQKGRELWESLSKDEPENQARPENLEQLIVLLTRESTRRLVHLINFTSSVVSKVPKKMSNTFLTMASKFVTLTDSMVKTVHLEGVQKAVVNGLKLRVHDSAIILKSVNNYVNELLEQLAESMVEKEKPKTVLSVPQIKVQLRAAQYRNSITTTTTTIKSNSNGVENNSQ